MINHIDSTFSSVSKVSPHLGVERETLYCRAWLFLVYIFIYILYVHNPDNASKILRTRLKKRKWSSWKTRHGYARFVNVEENDCRFEDRKTLESHATCMMNSCQGKIAGVFFRLNDSIHQHAPALDVLQVLDGRNYFQSCYFGTA